MWRFITYYGAMLISAPFSYFTKGKRRDDEIKQIEEEVDKLDINSIIDSYETTISEWTKTKIGDDDTFYSETHRCSYYSDAYLETILPSYHSEYKDSGYTTNWPWTSKKEIDEMHLESEKWLKSRIQKKLI